MQNDRDVGFTPAPDLNDTTRHMGATAGSAGLGQASDVGGSDGVTDRAKNVASDVRERAAEQIQARASETKHRATDSLSDVAESLRTASQQLPHENGVGRYMLQAANQVDNLATFLENREMADLLDGMEHFARRQPAVFVGGAFALGVLGARFLKSSRRGLGEYEGRGDHLPVRYSDRFDLDPTRDSVSRPTAPGYEPPSRRGEGGYGAPGSF
jgi:hypothetical protein